MARDNFKKSVIEKLKNRVSLRCSNPDCRVPTSAPSTASSSSTNSIGVAAHICAAAPGGPRYDKKMTPNERTAIENAVWLCTNCSTLIDRDENKYAVIVLAKWKQDAENLAVSELGRRLPNNKDVVDTFVSAFTGNSKTYIPSAIGNVHAATKQVLEALDPRFSIQSAYQNGIPSLSIAPKEDVSLIFKAILFANKTGTAFPICNCSSRLLLP